MSAQKDFILITDVGSYLGSNLAKYYLDAGFSVYGQGKHHPPQEVISNRNFTLIEFDFSQPIPQHFPQFSKIYHIMSEDLQKAGFSSSANISPATSNLISLGKQGKSQVYLLTSVRTTNDIFETLASDENTKKFLKLFLIGDIYGPGMPLGESHRHLFEGNISKPSELTNLISQAIWEDKIILQKEGETVLYPSYIEDVVEAIIKLDLGTDRKNIRFLVSSSPKTALTVAFEIQKIASVVLEKELNLFFEGAAPQTKPQAEPEIKILDTAFFPKLNLTESLKKTLIFFRDTDQVKKIQHKDKIESQPEISSGLAQSEKTITPKPESTQARQSEGKSLLSSKGSRPKQIILTFLILLLLTFAKTAVDIYLGVNSLKSASTATKAGDFEKAQSKSASAANSFRAAYNKTKIMTYPYSLVSYSGSQKILNSIIGAQRASASVSYFSQGAANLSQVLKAITSQDSKSDGIELEAPAANFKKAYFESSAALEASENSQIPFMQSKIDGNKGNITNLVNTSYAAWEFTKLVPQIIGTSGKKTYLVLLQNNTELRPGGGFIGSYALIQFENAKLKNIKVEDIYAIDGQLKEIITPPPQLTEKLGQDKLYLRDSNWSLDFEINGKTAQDFFKKETGIDVDGVIAIDLNYIQNFLSEIGPIKLGDFNEEISSENLFEKGEYYAEVGFFPGSTQKKDFFSSLTKNILDTVIQSFSKESKDSQIAPLIATLDVSRKAILEKHLLLSANDQTLASVIKTNGWNNPIPPKDFHPQDNSSQTRDYIAISEANLGANKVNRFLERKIDYDMTIGRDADLIGTLKITYTNKSTANTWPGGTYVNFLRVYLPPGAGMLEYKNSDSSNISDVTTTNINNLTELATFVEVPIGQTQEILFKYRISKNIKLETAPTYSLYVQKQPGTQKDAFNFNFHLPGYLKVASFNLDDKFDGKDAVNYSGDLAGDKHIEIGVARK